jgi:hypothetical protein
MDLEFLLPIFSWSLSYSSVSSFLSASFSFVAAISLDCVIMLMVVVASVTVATMVNEEQWLYEEDE